MFPQMHLATARQQSIFPDKNLPSRFYFDLSNGQSTIRDLEGVLAADLDEAIREARAVLEEIRERDDPSEDEEGWLLIIKDASGETLMTLPVFSRVPTPVLTSLRI